MSAEKVKEEKEIKKPESIAKSVEAEEKEPALQKDVLKLQKEIIEGRGSPLMIIREKELEIKGKVLEAKKQAEKIIADARKKASAIMEKADQIAADEAKKYYETELKKTKAEAEKIRKSSEAEVKAVLGKGNKNLDKATSYILEMIMPKE